MNSGVNTPLPGNVFSVFRFAIVRPDVYNSRTLAFSQRGQLMKKSQYLSACAMFALTALAANAQKDASPGAAPTGSTARVEVPEVSFNFGYVPQGASISHTFWLRSVGGDTLRITDVRPG